MPSVEALHLLLLAPSPRAHSTSVCRKPLGTGLDAPWGRAKCQWSSRSDCPSEFGQPLSPSALPYWPFRSCGPPTRFTNTGPYQLDVQDQLGATSVDPVVGRLGSPPPPSRGRLGAVSGPSLGQQRTSRGLQGDRPPPGPPPAPENTSNSLDTPSIVCRLSGAGKYGGRPMMTIKREGSRQVKACEWLPSGATSLRVARLLSVTRNATLSVDQPMLSIVVPAFNEEGRLLEEAARLERAVVRGAVDPSSTELIVVDDGSSDNTAQCAEDLFALTFTDLHVLRRQVNSGKGAAIRDGIAGLHASVVAFMDADMAVDPRTDPTYSSRRLTMSTWQLALAPYQDRVSNVTAFGVL